MIAAAATVVGSVRMAGLGDVLADRTGWGEAVFGAVFFGLATSSSGIVMTAVSAASVQPGLRGAGALWAQFIAVGAVVAAGGWIIAEAAEVIVASTGLSAGFVGAVFMGLVNALPETVTAIAAVRRGAMILAVSAVIGGNSLDVLNLAVGELRAKLILGRARRLR
ncbi:hypothetical protein [Murinocardiopsis flavida]|uniref:hypothetical protein n=1 Tax=Murinocardiopsis flavida TaxID=645275 RepID=UPI001FE3BD7B|nr:hypothetical protein [Murinocardiopsis flavida]